MDNFDVLFAKSLSKGGGGSGTDNYNELSNKPQINGNTLNGNKTGANLGLQDAITSESKLSSDLVDDTGAENLFVSSTEKSTWGGKQDPATTLSGYGITDAYTKTETGTQITNAIGALDVSSVGGSGKYISAISETDGKISATAETMDTTPTSGSEKAVTSGAVYTALASKQDALSQSQLAAASSGITATKLTADETALGEVINGGAAGTKNLLNFTSIKRNDSNYGTNVLTAGVRFTLNSDGTITATRESASSDNSYVSLCISGASTLYIDDLCDGNHILSGCPSGGSNTTYRLYAASGAYAKYDTGNGVVLTSTTITNIVVNMIVYPSFSGTITFKPMLCRKTLYDVNPDYEPYAPAKTNVEITPALVEVVDAGAKNFLTENTKTETGQWTNIPVVLQAGSYVLAIGTLSSTDTDAATCQLGLFNSANQNLLGSYPQLNRGNNIVYSFEITSESSYLRVYSSDTTAHGEGDTVTVTNAMICTLADWNVSQKFVPYCPSMAEMYQMILALQNSARSAPALAKAEPEEINEPETGEEEMR